jgi:hypothetical protein
LNLRSHAGGTANALLGETTMTGIHDVQQALDKIVATGRPNHGPFWRGLSRDERVKKSVYRLPLVVLAI